jgi:NitT/TauT family transport system permease protein
VFAPVYFALFGTSRWSIVGLIIHYSIFYLIVNTTTAVRAVDIGLIEMAKVFGADERQRMRLILLPSALPLVFASMRVAMARSVKGMINGEVLIAVVGLGAINQEFARVFDLSGVFAVASVVVAIAMFLSFVLSYLDRRINHWVPNARKS